MARTGCVAAAAGRHSALYAASPPPRTPPPAARAADSTLPALHFDFQVDLIGHSAGGWLARAFLGRAHELEGGQPAVLGSLGSLGGSEGSLSLSDSDEFALGSSAWTAAPVWAPHEGVASIVSLGTPHLPAPADKVRAHALARLPTGHRSTPAPALLRWSLALLWAPPLSLPRPRSGI